MNKKSDKKEEREEFEQRLVDIARVTRVMAGGKRMRFRTCVVVGNKAGKVGMAVRKGADVSIAINKATTAAKKHFFSIQIINDTIPHKIVTKFGAAKVLLKPAPAGTGVRAGGPIRAVLELAGIKNIVSKMLGSKNKINNVHATILALETIKDLKTLKKLRKD